MNYLIKCIYEYKENKSDDAFEVIIIELKGLIYNHCLKIELREREDLKQELLVCLYKAINSFTIKDIKNIEASKFNRETYQLLVGNDFKNLNKIFNNKYLSSFIDKYGKELFCHAFINQENLNNFLHEFKLFCNENQFIKYIDSAFSKTRAYYKRRNKIGNNLEIVSLNTYISEESGLLDIIEEAESYEADYLVLEINDSTIQKGLTKDIPFDIRVLTNLNPLHNLEAYSEREYVSLKKAFFSNISNEEKCTCVIGLQDYDKDLYHELLNLNKSPKLTFSSEYIANVKQVNSGGVTCLLEELNNTVNGLEMSIRVKEKRVHLKTKMMMNYNAMNFVCVSAILEALNILDEEKLNKCIKEIKIPGRAEMYYKNGRLIMIDTQLAKMLEGLKLLKAKDEIKKVKVVVGAIGSGYKYWEERFNKGAHFEKRHLARQYACSLLKQYADFVYLTENDNGAESVLAICAELQDNLEGLVPSTIIEDREDAIRQALLDSKEGDAIFISGRGNRRVLCNTATTMKLVKDSEVVEKVLKELGW